MDILKDCMLSDVKGIADSRNFLFIVINKIVPRFGLLAKYAHCNSVVLGEVIPERGKVKTRTASLAATNYGIHGVECRLRHSPQFL